MNCGLTLSRHTTAQCLVNRNQPGNRQGLGDHEFILQFQQRAFRVEHTEVVGNPIKVTLARKLSGFGGRTLGFGEIREALAFAAECDERVLRFFECENAVCS